MPPDSLRSTFVVAFQARTQFFLNCQATQDRAGAIEDACARVRATFEPQAATTG